MSYLRVKCFMRPSAYLLLLFLMLMGATACSDAEAPKQDYTLQTAVLTDFEATVQVVGDIEAQKQIFLAPFYSAKLEKLVEDGSTIKKDQVVARLESKDIEESLSDKELELEVAGNDLNEQNKNSGADKIKLKANIELAQKILAQKKLALDQARQGTRTEELRRLDLKRQLSYKTQEQAKQTLALKQELLKKGVSTLLEVLQAQLKLANAEREHHSSEAAYKTAQRGATTLTRQIAQLEYQRAANDLVKEQRNQSFEVRKAALTQQKMQAKIKGIQKEVEQLKEKLKRSVIKAPMGWDCGSQ